MARARTITSFGGFFGPFLVGHGPGKSDGIDVNLPDRNFSLALLARDFSLNLRARNLAPTLFDREFSTNLNDRKFTVDLEDRE